MTAGRPRAPFRTAWSDRRLRSSAKRRDVDRPLAGSVELAEEDALPGSERELAVADRHEHLRTHQRSTDVRGSVLLPLFDVLPAPLVCNHPLERLLEVPRDRR